VTTSSITSALFNRLAQVSTANAQTMVNYRLKLVGDQLTAQLNKKIAQLKGQSQDPMIPALQQQAATLTARQKSYTDVSAKYSENGNVLADLGLQLSNLPQAASAGDAAAFDQALGAANTDLGDLQVVPYLAGLQGDSVASLKYTGLGIQSSATYDLSTPAGQAQAISDVQAAQSVVQQIQGTTTVNQQIANTISQALEGQLTAISNQISNKQFSELTSAATQITKLKQQSQERFHLIELAFANTGESANMLQAFQNSQNIAPPPGSVVSLMVGSSSGQSLPVANVSPIAPPVVGSKSKVSTTA
jgi:hypothetical protein